MFSKFKKYRSYLNTSLLYLGSSLITALLSILINPLLAKNLSHEDYAIIGYFTSFQLLLIPLIGFNLTTYYLRNYSRIQEDKRQLVSDTILIGLIFIGFLSLVLFTLALYFFCSWTEVKFSFFPYAIYTTIQTYISIFFTFYLIKLRINQKAKKFALVTVINALVTTALTLVFVVYYKQGADGKLFSSLLASALIGIYSIRKALGKWQFDFKIFKEAISFGLPLTISALFWYFLTGVDRAFLVELNNTHTFGIYSVAIQITAYMAIFFTAVNNTFEPDIYQAIAENNKKRLLKLIGISIGIVALVNLFFIALAPFAIGLLTANRYIESVSFARILALQNITMACYYMVVKLFIGYGHVKAELTVRIIGAAISVLMYKILIDKFGFYGAAWGQVFSFLLLSTLGLCSLYFIRNKTNISLHMASKKSVIMNVLMLVMILIFITPLGYTHYTALSLLPFFLAFTGKKRKFFDMEFFLLMSFSLSYTLILIINKDLQLGIGVLLKYFFVPSFCYLAGKVFIEHSNDDKTLVSNLLILMFFFSLLIFLSIAKDIGKYGYLSTNRNMVIIGGTNEDQAATMINAMLMVWIVMSGFIFYQARDLVDKKWKLFSLFMSFLAISASLRLGSRTGLVLVGASSLSIILYNFKRYSSIGKLWLLIMIMVVVVGAGNFIANNEEVFAAFTLRNESEEFGVSTGGGRTELWKYFGSRILEYPMGNMPTNETESHFAHNYFIDIARLTGVIPLTLILIFTFSAVYNVKKILFKKTISPFVRNLILVLNVGFYLNFMVEPVLEGYFSVFMIYLFICGVSNRLVKNS